MSTSRSIKRLEGVSKAIIYIQRYKHKSQILQGIARLLSEDPCSQFQL